MTGRPVVPGAMAVAGVGPAGSRRPPGPTPVPMVRGVGRANALSPGTHSCCAVVGGSGVGWLVPGAGVAAGAAEEKEGLGRGAMPSDAGVQNSAGVELCAAAGLGPSR